MNLLRISHYSGAYTFPFVRISVPGSRQQNSLANKHSAFIMKSSTTRNIPPPIDLSVSGSNLRGTSLRSTSEEQSVMGSHHPYAYTWRYITAADELISPVPTPTATPPTAALRSSPSCSEPIKMLTPNTPNSQTPMTSSSDRSFLSISEWDDSRLVPNRRRRSQSEVSGLSVTCERVIDSRSSAEWLLT